MAAVPSVLQTSRAHALLAANAQAYQDPGIVESYRTEETLQAPEIVILQRVAPTVAGRPVLDIGVGAGRTTPHLLALSRDYTALDYSPAMVGLARERFPGVRIVHGDVRDLSAFPAGHFALVVFSFNGLDYISHADRLTALGQMRARLAPGGWLVFSTHNRDAHFQARDATRHPVRALVRRWRNWTRRRAEIRTDEYAILNDAAHNNRLMTYYIRLERQREQLLTLGPWTELRAFDIEGHEVDEDPASPWITWLARVPA